ncbi:MAG: hypothetical protein MJ056_05195, partial [Akkermansia sp.]|nr:hypothetical protein [Akkermansia sp.]
MKLHLNATLHAALIAAITAVGFTLSHAQAATTETTLTTTFANCNQGSATSVTTSNAFANTDVITMPSSSVTALYVTGNPGSTVSLQTSGAAGGLATLLTPNSNVGNGSPWTMEMSYSNLDAVESISGMSLSVGLFNASGAWQGTGASWTGDVTFTATVTTDGGSTATYTGYLFNNEGGTHHGVGDGRIAVTLAGETTLDLSSASSYTVKLELTETLGTGTFVGIDNIGYSVVATLPEIGEYTWQGTEANHTWASAVWHDGEAAEQNFSAGSDAIFGTNDWKQVSVTESVTARNVSVTADGYSIDVADGQTLAAKEISIAQGSNLTVTGAGALNVTSQIAAQGNMNVQADTAAAAVVISADQTLTVTGADMTITSLSGAGNLTVGEGGTATVNGQTLYTGTMGVQDGGTLNLGSAIVLSELTVADGTVTTRHSGGNGVITNTLTIGEGGT